MSDIMDDLRAVENLPVVPARRAAIQRILVHKIVTEHAPDLHELILGVPVTADLREVILGGEQ